DFFDPTVPHPIRKNDRKTYSREHIWGKAHGFPTERWTPYTDLHALFLTSRGFNNTHVSQHFDTCRSDCVEVWVRGENEHVHRFRGDKSSKGIFQPAEFVRGDVARALLYLAFRYDGQSENEPDLILTDELDLIEPQDDNVGYMGKLSTLLEWNQEDPPDDDEERRNDRVFEEQGNRNPFVDQYKWVGAFPIDNCSEK
ncbi:MAG: endonuclease, partial [Acidobacteriota bacterium]